MKLLALLLAVLSAATGALGDTFFVANQGAGSLFRYDENGNQSSFTSASLNGPIGLALDSAGNLFVSTNSNTIEKFSPTGTDLGTFADTGLNLPMALAFDRAGNLYAANSGSSTIEKFSSNGADLGLVAQGLAAPVGLAFDRAGSLYVTNSQSNSISKISSGGALSNFASTDFNPAFIAVQTTPALVNISTRGRVLTGENVLDAGFIVRGAGTKNVLIRGLGPSLSSAGVPGALVDPVLELHGSSGALLMRNDDWKQTQEAAITSTGIPPTSDAESALVVGLTEGSYTVVESGKNGSTGVGLVEIYDLAPSFGPELVNISTRGSVGTDSNVMIAGVIVAGHTSASSTVIVRLLGPSLAKAGVTDALADPMLELFDSNGTLLSRNDDWKATQQAAIQATGVPPPNDKESAIVATLSPGNYTAVASGKDADSGVGLIEVYNLH